MKSKKIVNLPYGQSNGDAVNKEQYDALDTKVYAEIIALQNSIDKINNWYYFTDQLKHNNGNLVKFPSDIGKYPFKSVTDDNTSGQWLLSCCLY